jgi:hypothetical protein
MVSGSGMGFCGRRSHFRTSVSKVIVIVHPPNSLPVDSALPCFRVSRFLLITQRLLGKSVREHVPCFGRAGTRWRLFCSLCSRYFIYFLTECVQARADTCLRVHMFVGVFVLLPEHCITWVLRISTFHWFTNLLTPLRNPVVMKTCWAKGCKRQSHLFSVL